MNQVDDKTSKLSGPVTSLNDSEQPAKGSSRCTEGTESEAGGAGGSVQAENSYHYDKWEPLAQWNSKLTWDDCRSPGRYKMYPWDP